MIVRVRGMSVYRLLILVLAVGFSIQPVAASPAHATTNGIVAPATGAVVRGVVAVSGVAQGADFAKWQLDLLPGVTAGQAVFLAVGETAAPAASNLAGFDSARFSDGDSDVRPATPPAGASCQIRRGRSAGSRRAGLPYPGAN